MLNEKMVGLGYRRSVIREIFEYGKKRKAEIGEENVFDFSLGNPSVPTPAAVTAALERIIKETDPVRLHGYTSAQGDMAVRAKIAESIEKRFGFPAKKDLIYMTCGAAASLTVTLNALINSGDEVIIPAPFFPEYRVFAESVGAHVVTVMCREPDFQLDIKAIESAVTEKTKAIIINSPNNPTGAVFSPDTIKALSDMLVRKQAEYGTDIYIIADEPYRELSYGAEVPYIPKYHASALFLFLFHTFDKLIRERIGYIFIPESAKDSKKLYAAVCGAGRALGFVCAPSLMQYTVAECTDVLPDVSAYKKNRDLLFGALTDYGYEAVPPDGAFYLFVKSPEPDAVAFCERAKKYELLLVPSDDFGCEGYVRISYCVTAEQIEKSLPAFKALIEEYK